MTTSTWSSSRHRPAAAGGVADGEELGVRGRIVGQLAFVVAGGDDAVARQIDDDGTDRDIAVLERGACFAERGVHPRFETGRLDLHHATLDWGGRTQPTDG